MRRPAWFEPVDSIGEWVGFLGGFAVVCCVVAVAATGAWSPRSLIPSMSCIRMSDSCMASVYRVRNDTTLPVVLRECAHRCGAGDLRYPGRVRVAPGQVTAKSVDVVVTAVPFVNLHVRDWWEVRSPAGHLLGCFVLAGHRHGNTGENNVIVVSASGPCGTDAPATPALPA
jgi:hypothetical protein